MMQGNEKFKKILFNSKINNTFVYRLEYTSSAK